MREISIPQAREPAPKLGNSVRQLTERIWRARTAYLFVLPLLLYFGLFVLYPVLRTVYFMFMRYEFLRPDRRNFVGLANLIEWVQDPRVAETFWVSVQFFLGYVLASTLLALLVALVLDRVAQRFVATLYRTIFYLPVVLPAGIIFVVWTWIYDPTWGVMNTFLKGTLGIPWPWDKWLSDPTTALPSLIFMSVWRLMGVTMILFLVGLSNIPHELREAARIDGATEWQVVRFLELPLLKPIFLIILVLRLQVLGLVTEPLVMTQGGPLRTTMTYGLQAYYISFRDGNWRMGYGSTWFVMLGLVSTMTAFLAWRLMREEDIR